MKRLLTSCFGLGLLPIAPGTWGSLPPTLIFILLYYFDVSAVVIMIVMASIVLMASAVCVFFAPAIILLKNKKDPGEVVADEVAGQAVVFLICAAFIKMSPCWAGAAGFLLFRLFDITKPLFVRKLEKLPDGWGILADDLLAGVYAGIVLLLINLWMS